MNKAKKSESKKILVRNAEQPLPKPKLIGEKRPENKVRKKPPLVKDVGKLSVPEINSTLEIGKKIDKIRQTKSQQFQNTDIAHCEKVTRKVNFPPDKAIYKDLIPLEVPSKPPSLLSSREPLPLKDKEPVLSNYIKPLESEEFLYVPQPKLENRVVPPQINNLRLYKIMQLNTE